MGALKIVLFGSFAQGRVRSSSDLDVISIMPSTRSGRQWMKKIYGDVDREVDCDILAYTPEELERTVPVSRFLRHALRNGRVIYEKRSPGIGPMLRGLTRPLLADSHSCVCWGLPLR
jgi:predicted nucleotidyltransferase